MQDEKILPCFHALHDCEVCLEEELLECHCVFFDPEEPLDIPREIEVSILPQSSTGNEQD